MTNYPTNKELQKEYDAYYTQNPKKWSGEARDDFAVQALLPYNPRTVLDVGCGNGHTLKKLGDAFPTAKLYGIDVSPVGCKLARQNSGAQVDCVFLADYQPGIKFDLTICLGTAEHFEKPLEGLKKIRALTSKICYLELPHNLLYSEGPVGFRRLTTRSQQLEWHLTRGEWESIIADAGFEVVEALEGPNPAWEFIWILK
jgi:SAM-dependent methyltransferase